MSDPKVIYLGPACEADTGDGRTWAEDDPWPTCDCGHQPVRHVLGSELDRVTAERDGLQLALTTADQTIDDLQGAVTRRNQRVGELERTLREIVHNYNHGHLQHTHKAIVSAEDLIAPAETDRDQGIPGTSFQRLNMLANQGE